LEIADGKVALDTMFKFFLISRADKTTYTLSASFGKQDMMALAFLIFADSNIPWFVESPFINKKFSFDSFSIVISSFSIMTKGILN